MKEIQMKMIQMFRDIINNNKKINNLHKTTRHNFRDSLNSVQYNKWFDFSTNTTNEKDCDNKNCLTLKKQMDNNVDNLINKINEILDQWEEYGYTYFIGKYEDTKKSSLPLPSHVEVIRKPLNVFNFIKNTKTNTDNKRTIEHSDYRQSKRRAGKKQNKTNKTKQTKQTKQDKTKQKNKQKKQNKTRQNKTKKQKKRKPNNIKNIIIINP